MPPEGVVEVRPNTDIWAGLKVTRKHCAKNTYDHVTMDDISRKGKHKKKVAGMDLLSIYKSHVRQSISLCTPPMQVRRRIPLTDNRPRISPCAAAFPHNQSSRKTARSRSSIRYPLRRSREWEYRLARVVGRTRRVASSPDLAPSQGRLADSIATLILTSVDRRRSLGPTHQKLTPSC